jgi:hypothetical protein
MATQKFFDIIHHPLKFRLFLLRYLPSAFFSGVRIKFADEHKAEVIVPYKWFSTNPFRSTYFACLGMAAEMSTGVLAMAYIHQQLPATSMLIVKSEAIFHKKATSSTKFICEDGQLIRQAIAEARASGKAVSLTARSVGKDEAGNLVAEFSFTWSFKVKTNQ